ncbi:MAG: hypothetical protein P4L36_18650 [Holophaga sp.]|nr:hypothetical protein [Holophaga sp.]
MKKILIPVLMAMAMQAAFAAPPNGSAADTRAQAWLSSLKDDDLVSSLKALEMARKGQVDLGGAKHLLDTLVTSMADVDPEALSYPGSMAALSVYGVILPILAEHGYHGFGELKQAMAELGTIESKAPMAPPSSLVVPPAHSPVVPLTPSGMTKTLESEGLTFQEAQAIIQAKNPRLPDGTYDEPVLSSYLGTIAAHDFGLAATLMSHYRDEQARLRAALKL